jgi:hypothetical protein
MGELLLGAVALIAILFLVRAFVGADPKALVKALRYAGAGALALVAIWLLATDRFAPGMFIASAAWGLFTRGHIWPGGWPSYNFPGRSRSTPGQSTSVRTPWLEMELDHDTGDMRGTILQGDHAGRRLDQLGKDALVALYQTVEQDDSETARLLEAYLDRTFGDWRPAATNDEPRPERASSGMSRAEALKVLGLQEGASEDDIRAAHRRLMLQNHPDKGGTDYIAAKINEAKDVLLPG